MKLVVSGNMCAMALESRMNSSWVFFSQGKTVSWHWLSLSCAVQSMLITSSFSNATHVSISSASASVIWSVAREVLKINPTNLGCILACVCETCAARYGCYCVWVALQSEHLPTASQSECDFRSFWLLLVLLITVGELGHFRLFQGFTCHCTSLQNTPWSHVPCIHMYQAISCLAYRTYKFAASSGFYTICSWHCVHEGGARSVYLQEGLFSFNELLYLCWAVYLGTSSLSQVIGYDMIKGLVGEGR